MSPVDSAVFYATLDARKRRHSAHEALQEALAEVDTWQNALNQLIDETAEWELEAEQRHIDLSHVDGDGAPINPSGANLSLSNRKNLGIVTTEGIKQ